MATVNNEQLEKDAKFRYLREMKHKPNLIKSIFDPEYQKLKELRLSKIQLSVAQCQAICAAIPMLQNLTGIILDDTGIKDRVFSAIVLSIESHIDCFRSITFRGKNNQLGLKAISSLKKLLSRQIPNNLTELKIENVTT